jgi:excisionase family DNA binding protein
MSTQVRIHARGAAPRKERPGRQPDLERKALRIDEACAVLGVGRSSIYSLMRDGRLGFVRLAGGRRRIPTSAIDAFIEQNLIAAQ